MFDIEYKGGNGLVITTKKNIMVVDPNLSVVGLKNIPTKDAVEVATEARLAVNDPAAKIIIEGPGEYEIGDFSISGTATTRHIDTEADESIATIYRIEVGEVRIALLGNIAAKLSEDQLEAIGIVDILIIPIGGGGYTLDASSAATLVRSIDPKVVIPVHYSDSGLKYEVPQENLEVFTKELGAPVEVVSKYKVKSASALPAILTLVEVSRT